MRPGGRLQAAIAILEEMERTGKSAALALAEWGRAHRFAGSADRAAIGDHLHDALRRRRSAAARLGSDSARAAVLGAALGGPDEFEAVTAGDRHAPPPLSAAERDAWQEFDRAALDPAVAGDIPDWCAGGFAEAFGPDWVEEAVALAQRPALDLRVNRLKSSREAVLAELDGMQAAATPISPDGIRIHPRDGRLPGLETVPAYAEGRIEIQDEGSQIAAILAMQDRPAQVLDYCAGGGGKTLAMSAVLENRGQIHAHDADPRRLAPLRERMLRAGCRNVQILRRREALAPLAAKMDLVLVDAPCTGTGTWRRRPETKWRLTFEHLSARMAEQDRILAEAARFVRPGGRLVYVTCSVLPAENEHRIEAFLAATPGFRALDAGAAFTQAFGLPAEVVHVRRNGIALTPARAGTDGFFVSILARA